MARKVGASLLARAIQQERWELAALCLLLGLAKVLAQLPPDAIEGVLDVLDGERDDREKTKGG